jgi:hypothetical protein
MGGMDLIDLAQVRGQWKALVNTVMNLRVPYNAGKFLSSCTSGSFSRRAQLHESVRRSNEMISQFVSRCNFLTCFCPLLVPISWRRFAS